MASSGNLHVQKTGKFELHPVTTCFVGRHFCGICLGGIGPGYNRTLQRYVYTVAQRTGEFGIRIALGAKRKDVLLMVIRSAARSVTGGVLTGVALTIILNRVLARWIQGNSLDALMLAGVILLLVATSGLSCLIPAQRASSVDPIVALRYE
jgi:ABC-type lipoprotein release transport system permease subunit